MLSSSPVAMRNPGLYKRIKDTVKKLDNKGVIVVCVAGNDRAKEYTTSSILHVIHKQFVLVPFLH